MLEKQLLSKSYKATHQGWELSITENLGEDLGVGVGVQGKKGESGHLQMEISNTHISVTMNPYNIEVITFLVNHFTTESEVESE